MLTSLSHMQGRNTKFSYARQNVTRQMKAVLKSGDWLNDEHMYLAQSVLQKQFPQLGSQHFLSRQMGLYL